MLWDEERRKDRGGGKREREREREKERERERESKRNFLGTEKLEREK